jgi:flagellar biosynthetic protein FliP
LALMTMMTLLPAMLLTMTSFTRIMIVFSLLRQALGTGQVPSNQVLLGLSLFLTIFIMMPVFDKVNVEAVQPYMEEKIDAMQAVEKASIPFRQFMLKQTRESDLELFVRISGKAELENANAAEIPFSLLLPAYVTSEIKTAFQIGFLIFLPFLIIDLVVASVLMSMGMMMLSPMVISLPFKIMLFVLADGWSLIMEMLAASFFVGT